jgi:hypothetical protein
VGFCDQKLRIINSLSWKEIFDFDHRLEELDDDNTPKDLNIFVEQENRDGSSVYSPATKPFKIPTLSSH